MSRLPAKLTARLGLAAAALALLTGQTPPVLPMPNATPTPMAQPHPKPAKPKPKPKKKAPPKPTATPGIPGSPLPLLTPRSFPQSTPSVPTFPGYHPIVKPSVTFPAFTPSPLRGYQAPGAKPSPYHGFGSPPPTPTPAPPRGAGSAVVVNWGGLSTGSRTLRFGQTLSVRPARGFTAPIQLMVVDPGSHEDLYSSRIFQRFPTKMNHAQKEAMLGDVGHFMHIHWVFARGYRLDLVPDGFLRLYEDVYGTTAGYQWPLRFLMYVVVLPPGRNAEVYYRLLVNVTH